MADVARKLGGTTPSGGFVLPVTLILLALISVGVALMSHRSDQLRTLALASQEQQKAAAAVQDALAQAEYVSAIMARRGGRMGPIELDGRFYRATNGVFVSLQDAGGLFNLSRASDAEIAGLLHAVGVPQASWARLTDTLQDYVDADDLVRLNGAEAPDYEQAKMPPPRNSPLLLPQELQRIIGWHDLDPAVLQRIYDVSYVGPSNGINRYTVTATALAAVSGLDADAARVLLSQRQAGQPVAIESLPLISGGSFLAASRFAMLPSTTLVITACAPEVAWCQRMSLTATPEAEAPWHVDYSIQQARVGPLPDPAKTERLPILPSADDTPPLMTPFGIIQ